MKKLTVLLLSCVSVLGATTNYVSPTGVSGNAGTYASPWSLAHGTLQAAPGTVTILKNGTYSVNQWLISGKIGTAIAPIRFQAETLGSVIIQGPGYITNSTLYTLVWVRSCRYVQIDGIVIQDSSSTGLNIDTSSYNTFTRLLVQRPNKGYNRHAIFVSSTTDPTQPTTGNLFEDCTALSFHRHGIQFSRIKAYGNVLRRFYANPLDYRPGLPTYTSELTEANEGASSYGASANIFENCVIVGSRGVGLANHGTGDGGPNNQFLGSVVRGSTGSGLIINSRRATAGYYITNALAKDVVVMDGSGHGVTLWHMRDSFVTNVTSANNVLGFEVDQNDFFWENGGSDIKDGLLQYTNHSVMIHNSIAYANSGVGFNIDYEADSGGFQATHTTWFTNNTADANNGNLVIDPSVHVVVLQAGYNSSAPNFDTSTYGKGGYLLGGKSVSTLGRGAVVLYRYVDGVLTTDPLWPWPMDNYIKTWTGGVGVTYEADGGLFKTLDGLYGTVAPTTQVEVKWYPFLPASTTRASIFESSIVSQEIRVYRGQDSELGVDLTGNWTFTGSAVEDTHFTFSDSTTTWTIPAGQVYASYTITTIQDSAYTGPLEIVVTLTSGTGYAITGTNPIYCDRIDKENPPSRGRDPQWPGHVVVPRR